MKALNLIAQDIVDVEILSAEFEEPYLAASMKCGTTQSLHDLGGGTIRLYKILLGFSASRGGILLFDELENGIHFSAQREIWRAAREWMRLWNVQLVATTHSREFIDTAIDAFADSPNELAIHKLYRNEHTGSTEVVTFSGDALIGARELDLEVR